MKPKRRVSASAHERFCAGVRGSVNRLLDGHLTPARRQELQRHLKECPCCYSRFEFARLMRRLVRERVLGECCPGSLVARIRGALAGCRPAGRPARGGPPLGRRRPA